VLAGTGPEAEAVQHVLCREAADEGDGKLSRRFYVTGSENREPVAPTPAITYERFDAHGRPQPANESAEMRTLLSLLNAYGQGSAGASAAVAVPTDLHRHLVNHGYFQQR
jgi:hypothetical protein